MVSVFKNRFKEKKKKSVKKRTLNIFTIAGILTLVGIPWAFGALTFNVKEIRLPSQFFFVVSNSLQGYCIFIYLCIINKEARESWKEVLSCGKYVSVYLNPPLKYCKNVVTISKAHNLSVGHKSSIDCTLSRDNFPSEKKKSSANTLELAECITTGQKKAILKQGHHGREEKKEDLSSTYVCVKDKDYRSRIHSETEFNESNDLSAIKTSGDNESNGVTVVVPGINTYNIHENRPGEDNQMIG